MKLTSSIALLLMISSSFAWSQPRWPSLDFHFKTGVCMLRTKDNAFNLYTYNSPIMYGEINWNISPYFSFGGFISTGFTTSTDVKNDLGFSLTSYPSSHSTYGVKLRVSSGRLRTLRPFFEVQYGQLNMTMESVPSIRTNSTKFLGLSLGLMTKLSNRLYLVLPQFAIRLRESPFAFELSGTHIFDTEFPPIAEISGGISYNIRKH